MSDKVLVVENRSEKGTAASRRARHEGKIPAVVYGQKGTHHILVNRREFKAAFKHISESEIITLKLDKQDIQALIKDYQTDMVRGEVQHLDFYEIETGKVLKTHVPLHLNGTPVGVREGGILEAPVHELEIECLPKDLPESITVDVSGLSGHSALHVRDIKVPAGVRILNSEDMVIAAVTHAKSSADTAASSENEAEEESAE